MNNKNYTYDKRSILNNKPFASKKQLIFKINCCCQAVFDCPIIWAIGREKKEGFKLFASYLRIPNL
jgi:hypothetical protein